MRDAACRSNRLSSGPSLHKSAATLSRRLAHGWIAIAPIACFDSARETTVEARCVHNADAEIVPAVALVSFQDQACLLASWRHLALFGALVGVVDSNHCVAGLVVSVGCSQF